MTATTDKRSNEVTTDMRKSVIRENSIKLHII